MKLVECLGVGIKNTVIFLNRKGLNCDQRRAVIRGGDWNNGAIDGPFCANLNNAPTNANNNIGFRCCNRSQSQICIFTEIANRVGDLHQFKSWSQYLKNTRPNIKQKFGG